MKFFPLLVSFFSFIHYSKGQTIVTHPLILTTTNEAVVINEEIKLVDTISSNEFTVVKSSYKPIIYKLVIKPSSTNQNKKLNLEALIKIFYLQVVFEKDSVIIIVDNNENKNFTDDYKIVIAKNDNKKFHYILSYKKPLQNNQKIEFVQESYYALLNENKLMVVSSNARTAEFKLNTVRYKISVFSTSNYFDEFAKIQLAVSNESFPDLKNIPISLYDSTKIGNSIIVFDSISLLGDTVYYRFQQSKKNIFGFREGYLFTPFIDTSFFTQKILNSSIYAKAKKYIVLDFWGTWCGPCIEAIPDFKTIVNTYNNKNIVFISVAAETGIDTLKIKTFKDKFKMHWEHIVYDRRKAHLNKQYLINTFKIISYPTTIVLHPNGTIVGRFSGKDELKLLEDYLNDLFKNSSILNY